MSILAELNSRGITIEKSKDFYKGYRMTEKGAIVSSRAERCDTGVYFLLNPKGKLFPCNDKTVYVLSGTEYEGKSLSLKEAEALAMQGKILSFKCSDLYAEYYNFSEDKNLECSFKYGYSHRSRKYIEAIMKIIGLIRYTEDCDSSGSEEGTPTNIDVAYSCDIYINSSETEVGKLGDQLWIAQTCYRCDIDDFAVIKMYFDHKPTEYELRVAFAIRDFETSPTEIFTCWECGRMTHWVDLDGDIIGKLVKVKDKYCGC